MEKHITKVKPKKSNPFTKDYKGPGFMQNSNFGEIMIEGKYSNGGKSRGTALYDVQSSAKGLSFHKILTTKSNFQVTGNRKAKGGSGVKGLLQHNNARSQRYYGDLFLDDHTQA